MTTLMQVYETKNNRVEFAKAVTILTESGIECFTTGITVIDQTLEYMSIFVKSHEFEKAQIKLYDIYFPKEQDKIKTLKPSRV